MENMNNILIKYFIFFFFIFSLFQVHSQNGADSLINALKTAKQDTDKVNIYLGLGDLYQSENPDTAIFYYKNALKLSEKLNSSKFLAKSNNSLGVLHWNMGAYKKAIDYYNLALLFYEDIYDKKGIADCYHNIGNVHYYQGTYDKALKNYEKALKLRKELGNKKGMASCYNNIGNVNYSQGINDKALEYYQKSLKIKEELGDRKGMFSCYNNIGGVHNDQGNFDKALEYFQKSLEIANELGDKKGMALSYNNIGLVLSDKGIFDKALEFDLKSLKLREEIDDKKGIADSYTGIGSVYMSIGNNNKALDCYLKSLKIYQELEDKYGMSLTYGSIAEIYIKLKKYDDAIVNGQKSLDIAIEINALPWQRVAYKALSTANDSLGNSKDALGYYKLYKQINDSLFNEKSSKQVKQIEARYQSEKKQLEIDNLTKTKILNSEQINKQQIVIISLTIGFLLIIMFSFLFYIQNKAKQKANLLLKQQYIEIQKKNDEIACQNQELKQQTQEIIVQRDLLKDTNNELGMINIFLQKVQNVQRNRDMVVIISDNNGKIEWVNNDFIKLYGYSKDEYASLYHSVLDRSENKVDALRMLMNNQIYTFETEIKTKNEESVNVKSMFIPIFDKNYQLFRIITIENEIITDFPNV